MVSRLALFIFLLASPAFAGPPTRAQTPLEEKIQTELSFAAELAKLPPLPATRPADIIRCAVVDDLLTIEVLHPQPGNFRIATGRPRVISTIDETAMQGAIDQKVGAVNYLTRDFSPPGSMMIQTTVMAVAGRYQIVQEHEDEHVYGKTEFIEDPPTPADVDVAADADEPVRLSLQQISDPPSATDFNRKLSARTFTELRQKYPDDMRKYLRPVLNDLGQNAVLAVEPAVAWQVLGGNIAPDPAILSQVKNLLPKLGSESYGERRAAMQSLKAIGQPAALALAHVDRAGWSAEQSSAIDTFLASFKKLNANEIAERASDPQFLLDVQYSDDVTLRTLAAERLKAVLGRVTEIDPKAPDVIRIPAVDAFRATLPNPTATTQAAK